MVILRRDVRAGRRSTVGNRVERVFVLEGSNPSLSAILAGRRFSEFCSYREGCWLLLINQGSQRFSIYQGGIMSDTFTGETYNTLCNDAEGYLAKESPEQARELLQKAISLIGTRPRARSLLSDTCMSMELWAEARSQLEILITLDEGNIRNNFRLAQVLEELGEYQLALDNYSVVLDDSPEHHGASVAAKRIEARTKDSGVNLADIFNSPKGGGGNAINTPDEKDFRNGLQVFPDVPSDELFAGSTDDEDDSVERLLKNIGLSGDSTEDEEENDVSELLENIGVSTTQALQTAFADSVDSEEEDTSALPVETETAVVEEIKPKKPLTSLDDIFGTTTTAEEVEPEAEEPEAEEPEAEVEEAAEEEEAEPEAEEPEAEESEAEAEEVAEEEEPEPEAEEPEAEVEEAAEEEEAEPEAEEPEAEESEAEAEEVAEEEEPEPEAEEPEAEIEEVAEKPDFSPFAPQAETSDDTDESPFSSSNTLEAIFNAPEPDQEDQPVEEVSEKETEEVVTEAETEPEAEEPEAEVEEAAEEEEAEPEAEEPEAEAEEAAEEEEAEPEAEEPEAEAEESAEEEEAEPEEPEAEEPEAEAEEAAEEEEAEPEAEEAKATDDLTQDADFSIDSWSPESKLLAVHLRSGTVRMKKTILSIYEKSMHVEIADDEFIELSGAGTFLLNCGSEKPLIVEAIEDMVLRKDAIVFHSGSITTELLDMPENVSLYAVKSNVHEKAVFRTDQPVRVILLGGNNRVFYVRTSSIMATDPGILLSQSGSPEFYTEITGLGKVYLIE